MEFSQKQTIRIVAALLLLTALSQALYTGLSASASEFPRKWLWGTEAVLFIFLAAVSGSALAQCKKYSFGFSAILVAAIFNFLQVGIGFTQFGPFGAVVQGVEGMAAAAGSVFAFSFFIYNAAKVLLGLSAVVFGFAETKTGSKWLGYLTTLVGVVAIISNIIIMTMGRVDGIPSGASGVIATVFIAICLLKLQPDRTNTVD